MFWNRRAILICRRRADQPHPLKWEFPGGKLEAGEAPEAALIRESAKNSASKSAGAELMRYEFAYPGKDPILLIFMSDGAAAKSKIRSSKPWREKLERHATIFSRETRDS